MEHVYTVNPTQHLIYTTAQWRNTVLRAFGLHTSRVAYALNVFYHTPVHNSSWLSYS